jgi:integrase
MACVKKRRGKWVLDFRDNTGRRRWETYETRKEADDALAVRVRELRRGTYCPPAQIPTVKEIAEAWLTAKAGEGLKPSTISGLENHVHDHIIPALGSMRLDLVSPRDVEALKAALVGAKALKPRTVNKTLTALRAVFAYAIANAYTERNPAAAVRSVKLRSGTVAAGETSAKGDSVTPDDVPSAEAVAKLIEHATAGLYQTFFIAAARTGARSGELLALTWADVDLEKRTLVIRRSLSWARTRAERKTITGGRFFAPKTHDSGRTIEIDKELASALQKWKAQCPGRSALGLVFPAPTGEPLHRRTLHKQGLLPALTAAELSHFTIHSLRHFHASALLQAGIPIAEVSARLGHANPAITMRVYAHYLEGTESKAAETIAAVLARPSAQKSATEHEVAASWFRTQAS